MKKSVTSVANCHIPVLEERLAIARSFPVRTNVNIVIVPNKDMTLANAEAVRNQHGAEFGVILDTNPLCVKTSDDLTNVPARYPNLRIYDHHGPSFRMKPLGQEETASEIVLRELCSPQSWLAHMLRSGKKGVLLTNVGNYDPDGVISTACCSQPGLCLEYMDDLITAAWFTDHALFGGRVYNADPDGATLAPHEKLGFTFLQRLVEMNEVIVDEAMADLQLIPDRDAVRSVFCGEKATYGPKAVGTVFRDMGEDMRQILCNQPYYFSPGIGRPWRRYLKRIQTAEKAIGTDLLSDGIVASYSYSERPDRSYRIFDWLACGAPAPLAPMVPLQMAHSQRTNQCVLSVPYSTQRDHEFTWDLVPVMRVANAEEEAKGNSTRWGGRGSVVFRFTPNQEYAVNPQRLGQIVSELYGKDAIATPK